MKRYKTRGKISESVASEIDRIRQDSSDVKDFVRKVFKNDEFKALKDDKEFIKYLKTVYESTNESINEAKYSVGDYVDLIYNTGEEKMGRVKSTNPTRIDVLGTPFSIDPRSPLLRMVSKNESKSVHNNTNKLFREALKEAKGSETYFNTFTDAVDFVRKTTEKRGFEIDEDDWQNKIAIGGSYTRARPSVGKTHTFNIGLFKNGKPQRKTLTISVYGMPSGKYELVQYIN